MVNGRGWIAIALIVFGSWRPGKALLGALLFAAFDAFQLRLQQFEISMSPPMLPKSLIEIIGMLAVISNHRHQEKINFGTFRCNQAEHVRSVDDFCSMSPSGLGCVKTRRRSITIEEVVRPRPF